MNPALHLAVLDDEVDITQLLANYPHGQGFRVTPLHDGPSLMALMPVDPSALVLLDLGLPGEERLSIARRLREHWRCGLVIVTGRGDSVDKIVGLEVGADGYVTKPFDLRELLARIKAVLRRLAPDHLPVQAPEERHAPGLSAPPASRSTLRLGRGAQLCGSQPDESARHRCDVDERRIRSAARSTRPGKPSLRPKASTKTVCFARCSQRIRMR